MEDISRRIAALSPGKLKLLKKRLKREGIALETDSQEIETDKTPPIEPVEKKEYYPLSSVQKRLFLIDQLEETGLAYNVPVSRSIAGNPGKKQIEEIFKTLVNRHETFRTSFQFIAGEPVQKVNDHVTFEIEYYDLTGTRVEVEKEPATPLRNTQPVTALIGAFIRPFDLSNAPLLRVGLIKPGESKHILMMDMHHIISDQASKRILTNEFNRLYEGMDLPPLKIQYKDFAQWYNSEPVKAALNNQATYWLQEFTGEIPVLRLPTDYPRPKEKGYKGSSLNFKIEKETTARLKALALKENTTLFVLMFSLYIVFLAKISNQKDIIVGTPVAGRRHAGLDPIIGMFVNTLPLRNHLEEDRPFVDFLDRIKKRTLDAFENQDYPFEDLVNRVVKTRDTGRNPIFDVFFTFTYPELTYIQQTVSPHDEDTAPEVKETSAGPGYSMFDMFLFGAEINETLILAITYSTELFKKETMERFIQYFLEIVSAVAANDRIKLKDIKISHDLGIAKKEVFHDEDDEFGF